MEAADVLYGVTMGEPACRRSSRAACRDEAKLAGAA